MTRHESLMYAAGLFDGEGCISLSSKGGRQFKALRVSMFSTCLPLLSFMSETFGGRVYATTSRGERRKDIWCWLLSSSKSVLFLEEILPHLRETNKVARARLVVTELAPLIGCNLNLSVEDRRRRVLAEDAILAIL